MINDHRQMTDKTPEQQAIRALEHILNRVADHPYVGYYLGYGSQSFALLTEAFASLTGRDVKAVREDYAPTCPRDPVKEAKQQLGDENAEEHGSKPLLDSDESEALEQVEALLESLARDDYMAAAIDTSHSGFELLQKAGHKEELASTVASLNAKYGKS